MPKDLKRAQKTSTEHVIADSTNQVLSIKPTTNNRNKIKGVDPSDIPNHGTVLIEQAFSQQKILCLLIGRI